MARGELGLGLRLQLLRGGVRACARRLAGWVAADPDLKYLAQKAFVTFARS